VALSLQGKVRACGVDVELELAGAATADRSLIHA
jgi:hypothetical protein